MPFPQCTHVEPLQDCSHCIELLESMGVIKVGHRIRLLELRSNLPIAIIPPVRPSSPSLIR